MNHPNMSVSNYIPTRKRICPKCNEPLKAVTVGNIVNSGSADKSSKFSTKESYMYGNVKSYRTEFQCINCRLRFTPDDLKKIDQSYKNK